MPPSFVPCEAYHFTGTTIAVAKQNCFRARYSAFDAPLIDINRKQIQYDDQQSRALDGSVFRPIILQLPRQIALNLMGQLFNTIRQLVAEEKYVVGQHAAERLEERGIMECQAVVGLDDGELIVERQDAIPNPVVEVREVMPDGTEFKVVWSHLRQSGVAKLVTVHFFDRG